MAGTDFRIDVVIDPQRGAAGAKVIERELTRVENRADSLRLGLGRMLAVLGGGAAAASAVRSIATFEQAISTIAAVSGASADEVDRLRQKTLELGAATRFTATESAQALADLARAGFTVEESLTAVGDTLLLAQAGGLGLAEATDIAATALRGFRLTADQTGRVADVLAAAANATNTSVGELGEGFKFVAPVAAGLNVSLEQAAAAMGVLSDAGLKASLAGTGLRRVLSELESPSATSQKILARLGITTDQVRVSQVGLEAAVRRLGDAGLTTGEALEFFGDRGGPAFEVLAKNIGHVSELTDKFQDAGGSAQQVAKIMDDNLNGALLRMRASFQNLILLIGQSGAGGGIRGAVESLTKGLQFLAQHADQVTRFLVNLATILGPAVLLGSLQKIIALLGLSNPFVLIATGVAAAAAAIPELQSVLESLLGIIGEVASAIASGFSFQGFLSGFASAIDQVVAFIAGAGAAFGVLFDNLATQPQVVGELMKKGFRDAIEAILDYFFAFSQTVGNIIIGLGRDVIELARNVGGAIGAISSGNLDAAQTFADNLTGTLSRAANRVTTFTTALSSNLKRLRDTELLPEVELSEEGYNLGKQVADEFQRAFSESTPTAQEAVDRMFGDHQAVLDETTRRAQEVAAAAQPAVDAGPVSGAGEVKQSNTGDRLRKDQEDLLENVAATQTLIEVEAQLNAILLERPDLLQAVEDAYLEAQIAALESSKSAEDGFTRAFLKMKQEAQDFAAVAESAVNAFADNATDALVEFATTGQFSFKEFARSLLADLTRIIARLLIVQALSAAFGGGATVGAGTAAGAAASGQYAEGGTTQPGRSYLVGEEGPELFTPGKTGSVTPISTESAPPQVNLQVVNVSDPNEVPQAISAGRADDAILNVLARNPDRVKQVLG